MQNLGEPTIEALGDGWYQEGGQAILSFLTLFQSEHSEHAWPLLVETYKWLRVTSKGHCIKPTSVKNLASM